ncbi:MAG: hypothetical protein HZA20_03010 [Nitrospirae bacterium]|nr:hypothetical protein [Nitrospirota bacterium]
MHRTQVMFEESQYRLLKDLSEKQSRSMSQVLRDIIDSYSEKSGVFALSSIEGIAEDHEAYGSDHDKWLYGKNDTSTSK